MSLFDDPTVTDDAHTRTPELVGVKLTGSSHGAESGDVLEVSEARATELVTAGLAKRL